MNISGRIKALKQVIAWLVLIFACICALSLALPTIANNIDDPNMIVYFNADEGGLMDIIWLYYSGEKRPSFQWDFDYGLMMLYLADFSRLFLSHFIHFTPGIFVLILHWIYLLAWILSFFALWRLVRYHFGNHYWQSALVIILLSVRPAFAYFSNNLKPEPLVLLITIIGLDFTLRIINEPFKKINLFIAVACAALAFLTKYVGIFLVPAIAASMYFVNLYQKKDYNKIVFPKLKISWIFPSFIGLILIVFPLIFLRFYIRKSTGFTWYEQFGFWGSLLQNKLILYICIVGFSLVLLSLVILLLNRIKNTFLKKIIVKTNELNSCALITCCIFIGFILLFGFRWIIHPRHFINIYAQFGPVVTNNNVAFAIANKGLLVSMFHNLIDRIAAFDPLILLLFVFYLCVEIYQQDRNSVSNQLQLYKRFTLLIFLILGFLLIFSPLRMAQHHMLAFFVAASILIPQGFYMFNKDYNGSKALKTLVNISLGLLLIIDISVNTFQTIKSRRYQFRQKEDVVYEIAEWWTKNIPTDTKILADHYTRVYIPASHKKVKTLDWNEKDRSLRLRRYIEEYRPKLVYYNIGKNASGGESMLPIEQIVPDKKTELVKSFENTPENYQCKPGAKFVIYRIFY